MKLFWVEGVFIPTGGKKEARSTGAGKGEAIPFYRSFLAESPQEALLMAGEDIQGGKWVRGPSICKNSEEERMRAMGAPELPFFNEPKTAKKKK